VPILAEQLGAAGAVPFRADPEPASERYQWLWLPWFSPRLLVTLRNSPAGQAVEWQSAEKAERGRRWGAAGRRPLTPDEWDRVANVLDSAGFWRVPGPDPWIDSLGTARGIYDGSLWLVQGVRPDRYQVLERRAPDRWLIAFGTEVLKLIGSPFDTMRVY